jgi:hypothetical protein
MRLDDLHVRYTPNCFERDGRSLSAMKDISHRRDYRRGKRTLEAGAPPGLIDQFFNSGSRGEGIAGSIGSSARRDIRHLRRHRSDERT